MLSIEQLLAFTLIYALDSVTPGPAVSTVVARAATTGVLRTLPLIVGLVLGDLFLFALAVAGLAALAAALGPLFIVVKWLGIAYLLYLAFGLWTATPQTVVATAPSGEGWRLLGLGTVLPLANPKAVGFYVALLPAILDATVLSWVACAELALVIAVVWGVTLYGYGFAANRAGKLLKTPSGQRVLNRCGAGAMVAAAGAIANQP